MNFDVVNTYLLYTKGGGIVRVFTDLASVDAVWEYLKKNKMAHFSMLSSNNKYADVLIRSDSVVIIASTEGESLPKRLQANSGRPIMASPNIIGQRAKKKRA